MKKTRTYGLIGLLLAVMLVAMIYSYGTTPGVSPDSPFPQVTPTVEPSSSNPSSSNPPNTSPNPSPINSNPQTEISPMKTFSSYDEQSRLRGSCRGSKRWLFWQTNGPDEAPWAADDASRFMRARDQARCRGRRRGAGGLHQKNADARDCRQQDARDRKPQKQTPICKS